MNKRMKNRYGYSYTC